MALSQTDIDKLKKAIAKGVRKVEYTSGSVEYQSVPDMLKALAFAENEIAGGSQKNTPSTLAVFMRD